MQLEHFLDIALVRFLSLRWILLHCAVEAHVLRFFFLNEVILSRLHGLVLAVLLDERVVHVGVILDHVVMTSLLAVQRAVQRYVPIALVEVDLESFVEQPFEGTHFDVGSDCLHNSTYCPETADEGRRIEGGDVRDKTAWTRARSCMLDKSVLLSRPFERKLFFWFDFLTAHNLCCFTRQS